MIIPVAVRHPEGENTRSAAMVRQGLELRRVHSNFDGLLFFSQLRLSSSSRGFSKVMDLRLDFSLVVNSLFFFLTSYVSSIFLLLLYCSSISRCFLVVLNPAPFPPVVRPQIHGVISPSLPDLLYGGLVRPRLPASACRYRPALSPFHVAATRPSSRVVGCRARQS
jgi:hypothetical protein